MISTICEILFTVPVYNIHFPLSTLNRRKAVSKYLLKNQEHCGSTEGRAGESKRVGKGGTTVTEQ